MQNPVASSAWLAAQEQLLLPLVTLTINTRSFCEPLWRSKPVLVIVVIYATLSFVTDLVRPPRHLNLLNLYNFPQSFRWQYGMIAGGGILAYVAWMGVTRVLLSQRQQRKIQP